MPARDAGGRRPVGLPPGALVAQLGKVVPGERGKPPGGQLRVAATREAVEILYEPR
ncbi:hypothetical protein [Streptomyces atratus]|uniref:hypothetical protein n=1 Tax=Streptomyces atratus TaxID=1893 RepID=UPI0033E83D23